jgi:RNA polymerase sigma-70 factor (ECF subfamily)
MNEYTGFSQPIAHTTITHAQSGDSDAMEAIYNLYANPCFSLAMRITANQEVAKDIVHNVFVKVMKNIQTFKHSGSFAGWVRQIAVNESIGFIQKNAKYSRDIELESEIYENATEMQALEHTSRFDSRWWETCRDLQKLTLKLSAQARAILFLHEVEGYSHKEIAGFFGKSESFSKQSLARTMQLLQKMNTIREV